MKCVINIDSDNDACKNREDVLEILDTVVDKLRLAGTNTKHKILDTNGNTVGYYMISADDENEDEDGED